MFVANTQAATMERKKERKIPNPPVRGIGVLCTFRALGMSMAPQAIPRLPALGVSRMDIQSARTNVIRMVVMKPMGKLI